MVLKILECCAIQVHLVICIFMCANENMNNLSHHLCPSNSYGPLNETQQLVLRLIIYFSPQYCM